MSLPFVSSRLLVGNFVKSLKNLGKAFSKAEQRALWDAAIAAFNSARGTRSFKDKTGKGRAAIRFIPPKPGIGGFTSGISTGDSPYTPFLNNGTGLYGPNAQAYPIFPRTGKVLRFVGRGGSFQYRGMVMHPGVKARHFMEEAERVGNDVLARNLERYVNDAITKGGSDGA